DGVLIPQLIFNSKANAAEIVRIMDLDDRHEVFEQRYPEKSYVHFKEMPVKKGMKTKIVAVYSLNGSERLGEIKWYPQWRRYTFFPAMNTLYDPDCLLEISNKVRAMTVEHKLQSNQKDCNLDATAAALLDHHFKKQS
ncbi:MAG: hypothetical protein ACLTXM_16220, partial [Enterococcus sp.]